MKPMLVVLLAVLLQDAAFAAEETCVNRCGSFNPKSKCQCDSMCVYYGSCCPDINAACPRKTRGDNFAEDVMTTAASVTSTNVTSTSVTSESVTSESVTAMSAELTTMSLFTSEPPTPAATAAGATTTAGPTPTTAEPTPTSDPDAEKCSERPFDAFLQLKNGSTYAFRGQYFFELDEDSVLPGSPKVIEEVWGMAGPIDAAFTRINCQGKTYIFKGSRYWRFDGDVLDPDYPREISTGFEQVPMQDIDAAFALPAPNHRGRERAYFFKGDKYYQYEFSHQPSHQECVALSPSVLFEKYTDVYESHWESLLLELFGGHGSVHQHGGRLTSRDWSGFPPRVDAAIVGQVYRTPRPAPPAPARRSRTNARRKPCQRPRRPRTRKCGLSSWDFLDDLDDWISSEEDDSVTQAQDSPAQHVYFFKKANYYRVNLRTKRLDRVNPPYPRSIARYWLGCSEK